MLELGGVGKLSYDPKSCGVRAALGSSFDAQKGIFVADVVGRCT